MGSVQPQVEQTSTCKSSLSPFPSSGLVLIPQTFLLRHVYASSMDGLQLSRMSAAFVTFLLSALCHELVMAVVSKKVRPYLFLMQVRLPLGWLTL
jgi:uncharacterized membrane protein YvlD (DUF360 family)